MALRLMRSVCICALALSISWTDTLNAHTFQDTCIDDEATVVQFLVEFSFVDGSPLGDWRTFFEVDVETADPLVVDGTAERYFVLHCPTGQFIKVKDVKVLYSYDDERGSVIKREATAVRLKKKLDGVARKILDDDEKQPLTDLIGHYEAVGYEAEFGRSTATSCACPLIGIPTIEIEG